MKKYLLLFIITSFFSNAQVVTTLAGSNDEGYADMSSGVPAQFNNPNGVATDASGNVYVADTDNNKIRKISPFGIVTTFAGSTSGYADGTGTSAKFKEPYGIAIDASGNLYVTDKSNFKIRKITTSGVVTTIAGSTQGYINGTGTSAKFTTLQGVAIDASGNLYVVEGSRIRKITPTGVVTTFAGSVEGYKDDIGTSAQFRNPTGVATDGSGNVYVVDTSNHKIRKITPSGTVTTFAGSTSGYADGMGTSAKFSYPHGAFVDVGGNVYVTDYMKIRKITPNGYVTTFAGNPNFSSCGNVDGIGTLAKFCNSNGISIDANGNLYVADTGNNKIRKVSTSGVVSSLAGYSLPGYVDGIGNLSQFYNPYGVATDLSGNLYIADSNNNKIRKITPSGIVSTFAGSSQGYDNGIGVTAQFYNPQGVAIDLNGNIYIADTSNHRIRKITPSGIVTTFAGSWEGYANGDGVSLAQFRNPTGVATDASGNVYVADSQNHKIRKITPSGIVSTFAGSPEIYPNAALGYADGVGTSAKFNTPSGVATDASGNVYVADAGNNRIRKITPSGVVTTLASYTQGIFNNPVGVATDVSGNVYVADANNNQIKIITPIEEVYTLAGSNLKGYIDGVGASAGFWMPSGVATDGSGNVYVADTNNNKIRKITQKSLGITQNFLQNRTIKLYPNPTHDILNIEVDSFSTIAQIRINDIMGKIIHSQQIINSKTIVSTSDYNKGIYFISLFDGNKVETHKFIVE